MKITFLIIFFVISISASFWLGGNIAVNRMGKTIGAMQAQSTFAHMQSYKDLHVDIMSGCNTRALERLTHLIDEQMLLMAQFVQSTKNDQLEDYINLRQPKLMKELLEYNVDWSKTWKLPTC